MVWFIERPRLQALSMKCCSHRCAVWTNTWRAICEENAGSHEVTTTHPVLEFVHASLQWGWSFSSFWENIENLLEKKERCRDRFLWHFTRDKNKNTILYYIEININVAIIIRFSAFYRKVDIQYLILSF